MITIHHLAASQSDRIVWLMEELELPYELAWYDRGPDFLAPAEYRALHPAGTSPIISDDETVLCESLAIVEYIAHRHGGGRLTVPVDSDDYADYLYWLAFSQSYSANLMSAFLGTPDELPEGMPKTMAQLNLERERRGLGHMNDYLAEHQYLAGDSLSIADIMMIFPLTSMREFVKRSLDGYPHIVDYIQRVTARPAYVKAMATAGLGATRP